MKSVPSVAARACFTKGARDIAPPLLVVGLFLAACQPTEPAPTDPGLHVDDQEFVWVAGPVEEEVLEDLRGEACVTWHTPAEPAPHSLQLVVDVSGSMSLVPPTGTEVKWQTTRSALRRGVALLPETTRLGVLYYPNRATARNCQNLEGTCEPGAPLDVSECIDSDGSFPLTPLGPLDSAARVAFEATLDAANPAGGTPTLDAYQLAKHALDEAMLDQPTFLVLITDGQPTFSAGCVGSGNSLDPVNEQPIVDSILAARQAGILTFVVGSPGSESNDGTGEDARPWLSRAALAGGTEQPNCSEEGPDYCHFDLSVETDFADGLSAALDQILASISPCEFNVPAGPDDLSVDPDLVNVILHNAFGAEVIGRAEGDADATATCEDGWTMVGDTRLRLCDGACERLRSSPGSRIEVLFGCEAAPVPPPK